MEILTCFRASMTFSGVTLNFRAPSCRRCYHRYCKCFLCCFRCINLFVKMAITLTLRPVAYLAQTVLWTRNRPAAAGEVRTLHHSCGRPGLPPGAAGAVFSSLSLLLGHVNCCCWGLFFLERVTCWAVQCTACCGCRKHASQPTLTTAMMKGRTEGPSLSFTPSLRTWPGAWSKVNWRTLNW